MGRGDKSFFFTKFIIIKDQTPVLSWKLRIRMKGHLTTTPRKMLGHSSGHFWCETQCSFCFGFAISLLESVCREWVNFLIHNQFVYLFVCLSVCLFASLFVSDCLTPQQYIR